VFITLDTLHVEGMVHVSELGSDYFQFNEAMHELRGERTGIRYRLTDAVQVQVSRVDLEARRIEFRLVKGTGFKELQKSVAGTETPPPRRVKRAAPAKPEALKGSTSRERRAAAKRSAKQATASTRKPGRSRR
jgi:ribonuclease R